MGVIRNAANTLIKGRVGQTTYYISGGQQIARQSRNDSNFGDTARRSYNQQIRRVMWANLVNFYKISAGWMPKAFENRKRNQTDYNKFMQVNMDASRIALTKAEAAAGACVIDGFLVSQGSLPSIEHEHLATQIKTNINLGNLSIVSSTTVGQFSSALVANNSHIKEGMQLSFVSYTQSVDPLGTPRAACTLYEVTLDTTSTTPVQNYLPAFCCHTVNNVLGTENGLSIGGYAYILSSLDNGALRVSTQQLEVLNDALVNRYRDTIQRNLAIASYGLDTEVVLSPSNTVAQQEEEPVFSILSISDGQNNYYPGEVVGSIRKWYNNPMIVRVANVPFTETPSVILTTWDDSTLNGSNVTMINGTVTVTFNSIAEGSIKVLKELRIYYGTVEQPQQYIATAEFSESE